MSKNKAPLAFTFGVELEFSFATNSDDASAYFARLEKDDPNGIEYATDKSTWPRADEMETLTRVARVVKEAGLSVRVLPQAKLPPNYDVWQVTADSTARLKHPDDVSTYLPDEMKVPEWDLRSWTHEGVELVSRILEAPPVPSGDSQPESLMEVTRYLDALRNNPTMPFRISSEMPYAGLHIHIGIRPQKGKAVELPLKVLQHLSFLLVQYEDVISSLHSFTRRGGCSTASAYAGEVSRMIDSNICSFIEPDHTCGKRVLISSMTDIRDTLFAKNMTSKKLAGLMSKEWLTPRTDSRQKFVNFQNIDRRGKGTVEFRQHQGTLSPEPVSHWVLFLTALMKLAERRSQAQEGVAQGPPMTSCLSVVSPPSTEKVNELLGLLELDAQARSYWLARYDRYHTVPDEVAALLTTKPCSGCRKRK